MAFLNYHHPLEVNLKKADEDKHHELTLYRVQYRNGKEK